MTTDITFCVGKNCNIRNTCKRYVDYIYYRDYDKNETKYISMFEKADNRECDIYWEVTCNK
jgi:hypothetical protein